MAGEVGNIFAKKWTPEQDAALRAYIGAGLTFEETFPKLNAEFGTSYSRNATVGRAKRIGLKSTNAAAPRTGHPQAPRKRPEPKPSEPSKPAVRSVLPAETAALRCAEVVPRHVALMDLGACDCRYPYGEDNYTFCGHPKLDDCSYCAPHYDLCRGAGTYSERQALR